ncbi:MULTISPECIES: hypothetical protein [unclassified Streptomyces]|uniref:hypothetical protein n=1 Tax=unclassified Streptomyces TaxID=2593676 RepID=UPI003830D807
MRRTEPGGGIRRHRVGRSLSVAVAAVALGSGLAACSAAPSAPSDSTDSVLMGHGAAHLPNTTASDWVTYADHVVVVSATAETEIAPTEEELARGEGVIGRTVDLKVEKVLWSRPDASRPAPAVWAYDAVGWQFSDGDTDNRLRMALAEQPRVEPGHWYVMALAWEDAVCSGEVAEPGQWRGLGEGSEVPFDGGVLGRGELEGRTVTPAPALVAEPGEDGSLEREVAGQGADALVRALREAVPQSPTFQARPQEPRDTCA